MQGFETADRNKSSLKTKKKQKEPVDNLEWDDDIPKLPGQDETFVGRPVLRDYYHQIIPTESRLEEYEEAPPPDSQKLSK